MVGFGARGESEGLREGGESIEGFEAELESKRRSDASRNVERFANAHEQHDHDSSFWASKFTVFIWRQSLWNHC